MEIAVEASVYVILGLSSGFILEISGRNNEVLSGGLAVDLRLEGGHEDRRGRSRTERSGYRRRGGNKSITAEKD